MRLPGGALAISGTAAVIGHASHHAGDVNAQADEAVANLHALLERAALPAFDAASPLKVYVRRRQDAGHIRAALAQHLDPAVPRILLHGDICRRELLVEIDGWQFGAKGRA
jgi:chorismate lyase/3-hydroxybenzoate synthase